MRIRSGLLALAALSWVSPAQAALIADFELNGSLANSAGTAATLVNNAGAGSLSASGITFGLNQGPTVSGLTPILNYTIDMTFTLDSLNGPAGNGYVKLVDFSNLASDAGFYSYQGHLSVFPLGNSTTPDFVAGQSVRLTLSRDAVGTVAGYIDSKLLFTALDPDNKSQTTIGPLLNFFVDDKATGQREASSGFVDYIRIYDTAITPSEAIPAVPEPASWAMMIAGLGLAGGVARRRRQSSLSFG